MGDDRFPVWWVARALVAVVSLLIGLWLGLRLAHPQESTALVRLPGNVTTIIKTKVNTKTHTELRTLPAQTVVLTVTRRPPARTVVKTHAVRVVAWRTRRHHHHHHRKHD